MGKETIYTKLLADFMAADEVGDSMVDEKKFVGVLQGSGIAPGQELAHFQVFADAFSEQQKKQVNYRDYCIGLVWRCQSSQQTKLQCEPLIPQICIRALFTLINCCCRYFPRV